MYKPPPSTRRANPANPHHHPLDETRRHPHDVLAAIWRHSGGGDQACPDGKNVFNAEWDGTYKVDDPLLFSRRVWCGEPRKVPVCSAKNFAHNGTGSAVPDSDIHATSPCPTGYYCSKIKQVDYDALGRREMHYTKCRRYPDPGLCSVGLFKPPESDPLRDEDEMTLSCHKDYDASKNSTKCVQTAFRFCVTDKKGHWAPEKCIELIDTLFAQRDEFEKSRTAINRLLIEYLKIVRESESETAAPTPPPSPVPNPQSSLRDALAALKFKSTPENDLVLAFFYDNLGPTDAGKTSHIPVRAGKTCGEWWDIKDAWCKNDYGEYTTQSGRNQHGCRWGQGKVECRTFTLVELLGNLGNVDRATPWVVSEVSKRRGEFFLKLFSTARRSGNDPTKQHELMNQTNIRRSLAGINGKQELVTKVIDKIFAPPGVGTQSDYFPYYLPLEHAHIAMWVEQVMDPTLEWLVYPFDMSQTRSKSKAECIRDMKRILTHVNEKLINASNRPNGAMSSGAWGFEDYLRERCTPLASQPGRELMNDIACKTWVTLPVSTLRSGARDEVINAFCQINNDAHAGSPECACFWSNSGNVESWQNAHGKRNYDSEKPASELADAQKRMYPPFCCLALCQNRGLQTQKMVDDLSKSCPDCVQANEVKGSNNKVSQNNSCSVKVETPKTAPSAPVVVTPAVVAPAVVAPTASAGPKSTEKPVATATTPQSSDTPDAATPGTTLIGSGLSAACVCIVLVLMLAAIAFYMYV